MKLYHYTNRAGATGILESGVIYANNGIDGNGVYLTSLGPRTQKRRLVVNNFDDGRRVIENSYDKVDFWFEFHSEDFPDLRRVKKDNRDIYMVPHNIQVYHHSVAVAMHY